MKTMKKIVCALMTLVLLLSSVPTVFADEADTKAIDQDAACSLTIWKFDYTNAKKDGVWDEDAFPSTGWQESYVENALVNTNRKGDTDGQNGNALGNGQTSKGYAIAGVEFTYHICEFAERIQRECIQIIPLRQSLPEKCFSALEATGEIITVTKGEKGYTPTGQYLQNGVSPKEAATALNDAAGVTKAQEAAMVAGSMFGWDTPAADPKNYDAKGVPIKNHRERDAR